MTSPCSNFQFCSEGVRARELAAKSLHRLFDTVQNLCEAGNEFQIPLPASLLSVNCDAAGGMTYSGSDTTWRDWELRVTASVNSM